MGQKPNKPKDSSDRKPTSSQSAKTGAIISSVSGDVGDDFAMLPAILAPGKKNVRFQQQLKAMQARLERYKNDMELLSKTHLAKDEFRMLRSLFTSFCKECLNDNLVAASSGQSSSKTSNTPTKKTTKKSEDYSLYLNVGEFAKIFFPKLMDKFSLDLGNFEKSHKELPTSFEDVYTDYEKIVITSLFNATSDFNKKKYLTFHRFVLTISTMCRGTIEERAEWCFGLYDNNHEGFITKSKLVNLMRALKHVGILTIKNSKTSDIEQVVESFFEKAKSAQNDRTLFKKVESGSFSETAFDKMDLHTFVTVCKEDQTFLNGMGIVENFFLPILRPIDEFVRCDNPYEFEGELYLSYSDIVDRDLAIAADISDHNKFVKLHLEIRGGFLNGYLSTDAEHFTIGNLDRRKVLSVDLRKIDSVENETQIVTMPLLKEIEKSQINIEESDSDGENEHSPNLIVSKPNHMRTSSFPSRPTNSMALSPSFSITLSKVFFDEMFDGLVLNPIIPVRAQSEKKKKATNKNEKRKLLFVSESSEMKMKWIFTILMYHLDNRKGAEGESCRFNSYAPERQKVRAKWYVDGKDAFQDIALAISLAKEEIFIADWCLHPTLYLLRGDGKEVADSRLDILLKKKASQGVKIYIMLWNETSLASLNLNTKKTKNYLKSLYPKNIFVKTHPKQYPVEWSHHQKLVVIDQSIGFLGGLDLCFGRWDDYKHNITDMNHSHSKYPGNDYQNPNFHAYYKYADKLDSFTDVIDREYSTRQAWHDIHCSVTGLAAKDCSYNFVERWNFAINGSKDSKENKSLKTLILKNPGKNPLLEYYDIKKKKNPLMLNPFNLNTLNEALQGGKSGDDDDGNRAKEIISKLTELDPRNRRRKYEDEDNKLAQIEQDLKEKVDEQFKKNLEYSDTDPSDVDVISPVIKSIDHKNVFENTAPKTKTKRLNHNKSKTLLPVANINSSKNSREQKIKKFQCADEGFLCNAQLVRSLCKWSGSPRDEQSVYAAYLHLIDNAKHYIYIENQYFIGSTSDLPKNVIPEYIARKVVEKMKAKEVFRVIIVVPSHPEGDMAASTTQQIMKYSYNTIKNGPNSMFSYIKKHVSGATDKDIENYIFFCTLRNYGFVNNDWRGSLEDTNAIKLGSDAYTDIEDPEESSEDSFTTNSDRFRALMMMKTTDYGKKAVTEHIYIHSKMMIVDDYITIIGSANINDRSMLGTRDSEIAVVIQDHPTSVIHTKMNGRHYKSGKFAHSLRIRCWREHLGLLPSQNDDDYDYDNDQASNSRAESEDENEHEHESDSDEDPKILNLKIGRYKGQDRWKKWQKQREQNKIKKLIRNDPICDATYKDVWIKTAKHNSQIYETVFPDSVISDKFKTIDQYLQSARLNVNKEGSGNEERRKEKFNYDGKEPKKSKEEEIEIHEESKDSFNDIRLKSMNFGSSKLIDSVLSEKEKRKLLKQLKGNLCVFPLDFCNEETWTKPLHVRVAVGDEIYV